MDLNSTLHCSCDGHGECASYNASLHTEQESELHRSWQQYELLLVSKVCYCDEGWTGYGILGLFQHETLMNCATNIVLMRIIWAVAIYGYSLMWIRSLQLSYNSIMNKKRRKWRQSFFVRPIIGVLGSSSCLYLSVHGALSSDSNWELVISFSPRLNAMLAMASLYAWYEMIDADERQLRRFVNGALQEFGLVSNGEYSRMKRVTFGMKCFQAGCSVLLFLYGASNNAAQWIFGQAIIFIGEGLGCLVNLVYTKPRTFRRLLILLDNMTRRKPSDKKSYKVLDDANNEMSEKILTIKRNISLQLRANRYPQAFAILLYLLFSNRSWWKYMGYVIIVLTLHSAVYGVLLTKYLFRKFNRVKKGSITKQNSSRNSVSAFSSVAPKCETEMVT